MRKERIRALGDRIIVKVIVPDEKTKGGVILLNPGNQQEMEEGIVIEVGPGRMMDNNIKNVIDMKVGDKVMYAKSVGAKISIDDVQHKVLKEGDVIAVYVV